PGALTAAGVIVLSLTTEVQITVFFVDPNLALVLVLFLGGLGEGIVNGVRFHKAGRLSEFLLLLLIKLAHIGVFPILKAQDIERVTNRDNFGRQPALFGKGKRGRFKVFIAAELGNVIGRKSKFAGAVPA